MKQFVVVRSDNEDIEHDTLDVLYWGSSIGWTSDIGLATVYDESEKPMCALPPKGTWLDVTKELSGV